MNQTALLRFSLGALLGLAAFIAGLLAQGAWIR